MSIKEKHFDTLPAMRMLPYTITIGKFVRRYGLLLVLLYILGQAVITEVTVGTGPMPQLPPNHFPVERGLVVLQWHRGSIEKPIKLQVSRTKEFDSMLMDGDVSGTTYNYQTELERGQTYYWRLLQADYTSPVSSFVVSPYHVKL